MLLACIAGAGVQTLTVRFPAHLGEQLMQGATISGTGFKVARPAGVVVVRNMVSIRPETITINGQTYLVR